MEKSQIELLQGMPIFGAIREDILKFLVGLCTRRQVPKDGYFFREHDPGQSFFVLESGRVAVTKVWQTEQHLLRYLSAGDCFGEMALMDFTPRSASVMAVEDSVALEIQTSSLQLLYKKDLEQFTLMQMNMGREVCRRLRNSDEQLFRIEVATRGVVKEIFRLT